MRVSIACLQGLDTFLDWVKPLSNYYETKIFIIRNTDDVIRAIGYGDVIWCEWANESAIAITKYLKYTGKQNNKKVIVRLHSYEGLAGYPREICWDMVNHIIYVSGHMVQVVNTYHNEININNKIDYTIVPNGIDISNIKLNENTSGLKICSVGGISHKKNPSLMLQVFKELLKVNENYRLHVAGGYQEARYEIYINHMIKEMKLQGKIVMHGNVKDMNAFYADKDYILLTSVHEGHNVSVIEAMARGIRPVIHNFYGADRQYREDMLFNTIDEAVEQLQFREKPDELRKYIIDKGWLLENQVSAFKNIIERVVKA